MTDLQAIAKDAAERVHKNGGCVPQLAFAPILFALQDAFPERPHAPVSRPGDGVEGEGSFEDLAVMLTKKYGNPIGTDYEQGQNDMGFRMIALARGADAALAALTPPAEPVGSASPVEIAYGCLWCTITDDYDLNAIRNGLRQKLTNTEQRRGIAWAVRCLPPITDVEIARIDL